MANSTTDIINQNKQAAAETNRNAFKTNTTARGLSEMEALSGIDTDIDNIQNKFTGDVNMAQDKAQNQFYQNMYGSQQQMLDTIKRSNASAVATGASKGLQAAQNLSALYGNQQETAAGATALSQDRAAALAKAEKDALEYSDSLKSTLAGYSKEMYVQDRASDGDFDMASLSYDANDPNKLYRDLDAAVQAGDWEAFQTIGTAAGLESDKLNAMAENWGNSSAAGAGTGFGGKATASKEAAQAAIESTTAEQKAKYPEIKNDAIALNIYDANVNSFGKFMDSGSGKGEQDKYVNAVITAAKNGQIPDGTIINFNYGAQGNVNEGYFVYLNGAFYESNTTTSNKTYNYRNFKTLAPTANYR